MGTWLAHSCEGTVAAWGVAGEVDRAQRCLAGEPAMPAVLTVLRFVRLFEMFWHRNLLGPGRNKNSRHGEAVPNSTLFRNPVF